MTVWFILGGLLVLRVFIWWEQRMVDRGREPLLDLGLLRNARLVGGLTMFFFQFLLQAGLFFVIPLFLSVALGLSALDTGIRLLPLSVTLLIAAMGIPRVWPDASPRRVVSWGLAGLFAGIVSLIGALEAGAGPEVVTVPLLLAGLGVGALSSQLGAVTVSAVPDQRSGEVGGIQNTATNLGASLGTALAGSVLIGALTSSFFVGIETNDVVRDAVAEQAQTELVGGVPFVSDNDLEKALATTDLSAAETDAIVEENSDARLVGLRSALTILAVIAMLAIFMTRLLPTRPVGSADQVSAGQP